MKRYVIIIFQILILFSDISYSNTIKDLNIFDLIKCATFKNKKDKIQIIKKKIQISNLYRPALQQHYESLSNKFLIHYDTTGTNAVSQIDKNNNLVPDYIDSVAYYFDKAYQIEVNEMGFIDLQSDSGKGGTNQIDVYIIESGSGQYGETFYGLTMNDLEIKPRGQVQRYTSFIVMDNDFSPNDSTILLNGTAKIQTFKEFGISAVKITSAHEFNHVLQLLYGEPEPPMPFINEMTSMLVEYEMYPDSKDYLQFVNDFLKHPDLYPFSNDSASAGYRFTLFAVDLFKQFGISLFVNTWELISNGVNPYKALDSSLVLRNSNINNEYCSYMSDLYNASILRDSSVFIDANLFIGMKKYYEKNINNYISVGDSLRPYEMRLYRYISQNAFDVKIKDSLDLIFTSFQSQLPNINNKLPYTLIISNEKEDNFNNFENSQYYYYLNFDSSRFCFYSNIANGIRPNKISTAFPNPFILTKNYGLLNIPVDANSNSGDYAEYHIYNSSMEEIARGISQVVIQDKYLVIKLDIKPIVGISSGVYLFDTFVSGRRSIGKFMIIDR